jgi:branched-chain amino acid transport system ATP-binding protein
MLNPIMLLLDEPSEGLAPMVVQEIIDVLRRLKAAGLGILLVEQNLRAALALADRHHILNKGAIVFTGTSAEIEDNDSIKQTYLAV